ncbi:MAG TPA: hypothetical protein VFS93_01315 [Terrimesophilobacter sp.]|nr:hypothetical protein [Terrimesophilobacter sp.]
MSRLAPEDNAAERELVELREAVLDDWLHAIEGVSGEIQKMERTLSWRVTKPLRLARRLGRKTRELGVVPTAQLAAVEIARRVGRGR